MSMLLQNSLAIFTFTGEHVLGELRIVNNNNLSTKYIQAKQEYGIVSYRISQICGDIEYIANTRLFAAEHRIKRPTHICILHRFVFTFVRNQTIVPCSKQVFLPGAACLLLDDLGLTGAPAADGFGELDSATRPSSTRPEQCTVLCAQCLCRAGSEC